MEIGTHSSLTHSPPHAYTHLRTNRDACVPYTDNQAWTEGMGYAVEHAWKPWAYVAGDNTTQVGGYEVVYDVASAGDNIIPITHSLTHLLTLLLQVLVHSSS